MSQPEGGEPMSDGESSAADRPQIPERRRPPKNVAQVAEWVWKHWGKDPAAADLAWDAVGETLKERPELADNPPALLEAVRSRHNDP